MRKMFKIISMPVVLFLDILLAIAKGILYVAGGIMNLLTIFCLTAGVIGMVNELYSFMIIPSLISAFLLSPFGIQLVLIYLTANVELFRDWIREI